MIVIITAMAALFGAVVLYWSAGVGGNPAGDRRPGAGNESRHRGPV
jgi:hypothetical protein